MNTFNFKKLWILLWRRKFLNELDEEMAFHRAQAAQEFIAGGWLPRPRMPQRCGSSAM